MSATDAGTAEPADAAGARQAIDAALAAADLPRAVTLAKSAVDRGFKDALFHNLVAHELQSMGRYAEAMAELHKAYELAPRDVVILNAIGLCLVPQGRLEEALKVYDAALSIEPRYVPTLVNKGDVLALRKDFDQARAVFQQAVAIHPGSANALAGLASLELRRGALDEASVLAQRALSIDPKQDVAALTVAEIETGGDSARAEALVREVLSRGPLPALRAQAESLLGDALDAQGRNAEAFEAYAAAGQTLAALHANQYARPGAPTVLEMVRWHQAKFAVADSAEWVGPAYPAGPSDPRSHIFFVGFPRSGTTLLEQILASHPDVVALAERQALGEATLDLFTSAAKLDRLRTINADDAQSYRDGYWRTVAAYCPDVRGKVFVDKYPLNADRLPLVAKLFPRAKVLFALRDPRDVVLSCFRRRFEMNPAMYEFCTLAGAATLYDAVMRLAEVYKAKLALPFHDVRHERVVEDLRREVGAVCDFIGVEWDDAMLDFAETARRRGVRTPSAGQVVRGLYDEGVGQWRSYAAELQPVMPLLTPWIGAFGYPAD